MQLLRKCKVAVEDEIYIKKISWFMGILISIDQLGNAIASGNPDSTISARIGYNMRPNGGVKTKYWNFLEDIVNTTFKPIDGKNHCFDAYYHDRFEDFTSYQITNIISKIILVLTVIISCIPLFIIIRLLVFLFPKLKSKYILIDSDEKLNDINFSTSEISNELVIEAMRVNLETSD